MFLPASSWAADWEPSCESGMAVLCSCVGRAVVPFFLLYGHLRWLDFMWSLAPHLHFTG